MPQMGEKPDGENMPQDTTTDESGTSTKGIKAGGGMYLNGGTYQIDSADDSIHSNANITIADGTYTLATGDDGVHADDALTVNGGTITVTESYEGLEGLTVTINDKQTLACDLQAFPDLAALGPGPLALRAERGPLDVRNVIVRKPE